MRALALSLLLAIPATLLSQRGTLVGVVVARDTDQPLAYSIVSVSALGRELFTNDSGAFTLRDLPAGPLALKVRRLGFSPVDVDLSIGPGPDSVRVPLTAVAARLDAVTVRSYPPCVSPGPPSAQGDTALATMFSQLQMNAEQFRLLSNQYPFVSQIDVYRTHKKGAEERRQRRGVMTIPSKEHWDYRPGSVVTRRGNDYFFNIPTLIHFADSRFLAEHCFHYAGVDTVNDFPMVRIDFLASDRIKTPDVAGALYLDAMTYQIRRSVLRLTRVPNVRALVDYEVLTDFEELLESIPVIYHVFSVQTFDTTRTRAQDAIYEDLRLLGVKFLGRKPGESSRE